MPHRNVVGVILILASGVVSDGAVQGSLRASPDAVRFRPHVVDADIPGGYAVLAVDVNGDGRLDLVPNSLRVPELAWYENPSWRRHVMVDGMPGIVNLAAADLDGDGVPELAVQSAFAMMPANSEGLLWLLRHDGDPRRRWKAERLDAFATSHHVAWADVDGDERAELINAPLVGPDSLAPTYDQDDVPLFWYRQSDWRRRLVGDGLNGILHRVRPVDWDGDGRMDLLAASFEGLTLYRPAGTGLEVTWEERLLSPGHRGAAPRRGASDVAVGSDRGRRFLASVEPWHGNEIVIHTETPEGWIRRVLFDGMVEGHEVAVGDLNGDGADDIVAGDRAPKGATVHVMYAPSAAGAAWIHEPLDAGYMAASGCILADLNQDGRADIVCVGSATANLKWYENLGR